MPTGNFSLDLTRFRTRASANADQVLRKVALDLLSSVVVGRPVGNGTPVDTGRARGGWLVEFERIPEGEGPLDPGGGGAISTGASKLASAKIGVSIFIANNVHYIRYLEYGPEIPGAHHSPQAPQGMLRVALAAYPGIVVQNVREVAGGR